jgi:hypothetical protein
MFTQFFIANVEEAAEAARSEDEGQPTLSLDGVTDFELIELSTILLRKEYEPELAFEDEEEGLFVLRMEDALVDRLAALTEEDLAIAGKEWSKAEGLAGLNVTRVSELLRSLAGFAAEAKRSQKPILHVTAV